MNKKKIFFYIQRKFVWHQEATRGYGKERNIKEIILWKMMTWKQYELMSTLPYKTNIKSLPTCKYIVFDQGDDAF